LGKSFAFSDRPYDVSFGDVPSICPLGKAKKSIIDHAKQIRFFCSFFYEVMWMRAMKRLREG
jgi:hypothetical protein